MFRPWIIFTGKMLYFQTKQQILLYKALSNKPTSLCQKQKNKTDFTPVSTMTSDPAPTRQYKTNVQSLHYLCCSHDSSCGCNIQPLSPKVDQCVIAFVLGLADIVINVLKQGQKSHEHSVLLSMCNSFSVQC